MEFKPIWKTTGQINSDAESFLKTYHPSMTTPIPIEEIIDLKLKIDIIPVPGLKDVFEQIELDIDAFISSDFKSITVDQYIHDKVNTRYRFTLAHEIGHMILHKYLYSQFHFNSIDEWIAALNEIPLGERDIVKWQANEFAGLVLVSRAVLKGEFQKSIKDIEKITKISYKDSPDLITDLTITFLAPKLAVSEDVLRIRLERDRLKKK